MKKILTSLTLAAGLVAAAPVQAFAAPAPAIPLAGKSLGWQQVRVLVGYRTVVRYVSDHCGCGVIPVTRQVPVYEWRWVRTPDYFDPCGC